MCDEVAEGMTLQYSDMTYLSTALLALREIGSLCDLVIRCEDDDGEGSSLFAHACILAACSPLLKEQIVVQKQAGDEFTEISGQGISQQVWEYVIKFMYSSTVVVPTHHQHLLKDITAAAEHLQFDELYEVACEFQTVLELVQKEDQELDAATMEDTMVKTEPHYDETVREEEEEEKVKGLLEEKHTEETSEGTEVIIGYVSAQDEQFQCDVCPFTAKSQRGLNVHSRRHAREKDRKPFNCETCSKIFRSQKALDTHVRNSHVTEESLECPDCEFVAETPKKLLAHRETHQDLEQCPIEDCDFQSPKRGMLAKHLKLKHKDEKRPFKCSTCEYAAETRVMLRLHEERHSDTRAYACSECDKAFKRHRDLWRHRLNVHGGDKFKCELCVRTFSRKVYLDDHCRRDHLLGYLVCPVPGCGLEFPTYDKMYRHKRVTHDQRGFERRRRHACQQCDRTFFTRSHLVTHELAHRNERPYRCDICAKGFLQRSDLTKHMMIHNGIKPFLCSVCPYTTNRASNLKTHEKRHKGKPFLVRGGQCSMCDYHYNSSKEFRRHQKEVHNIVAPTVTQKRKGAVKTPAFREMIIRFNQSDTEKSGVKEEKPVLDSTVRVPAASPTQHNVLEKRDVITIKPQETRPEKSAAAAVERRVRKSAIIAEFRPDSSLASQSSHPVYTPVDQLGQPQKYTQIVTTTLANSGGKIKTILQSSNATQLPSSLCIVASSHDTQPAQQIITESLPMQVIHDVSLGTEALHTEDVDYSPAVYTIMNPETPLKSNQLISPQPTAMDDSEDYAIMDTSKDD